MNPDQNPFDIVPEKAYHRNKPESVEKALPSYTRKKKDSLKDILECRQLECFVNQRRNDLYCGSYEENEGQVFHIACETCEETNQGSGRQGVPYIRDRRTTPAVCTHFSLWGTTRAVEREKQQQEVFSELPWESQRCFAQNMNQWCEILYCPYQSSLLALH